MADFSTFMTRKKIAGVALVGLAAVILYLWRNSRGPVNQVASVTSAVSVDAPLRRREAEAPPTLRSVAPDREKKDELDPSVQVLLQPGNKFLDLQYGVTGTIPDGWTMREVTRWSLADTTLHFRDPSHPL